MEDWMIIFENWVNIYNINIHLCVLKAVLSKILDQKPRSRGSAILSMVAEISDLWKPNMQIHHPQESYKLSLGFS